MAGRATNFTASGTLNPDDTMFGFDIYIFLKNPDADPTCAADFDTESANALHSGGNESWVSPAGGFQVGDGPRVQPAVQDHVHRARQLPALRVRPGRLLHVREPAELRGAVAPAPRPAAHAAATTPTVRLPAVVRAPWITRKGHVLTCHAGHLVERADQPQLSLVRQGTHGKTIASRRKLTVRRSLRGRMVACRVTATNAAGHTTASTRSVRAR